LGWAQELVGLVEGPCAYVSREGGVLAGNEAFVVWAPRCLAGAGAGGTSHDAKLVGVKDLPLLRKPLGAKLFADRVEQLLRRDA